jgi:uncharacterized metal-binding protein YceD (DUF177 family)
MTPPPLPGESGLSRIIAPAAVSAEGRPFHLEASPAECRRLAHWLGVDELTGVHAEGTIVARAGGRDIAVAGRLEADVVQTCVVSLQPLHRHIGVAFERLFSASLSDEWGMYDSADEVIFIELENDLVAEPLPAAGVDLGTIVAEELSLQIDPYPRSPAVPPGSRQVGEQPIAATAEEAAGERARQADGGEGRTRPFAALAKRLSKR